MEQKDNRKTKERFSNNGTIFLNADYVVVEYIDLIKVPYFVLLSKISMNPNLAEILNINEIKFMKEAALFEWYVNRKHQNFFLDLNKYPNQIGKKEFDQLLNDQLKLSKHFFSDCRLLPLGESLRYIKSQKITKDIIIYYPHEDDYAQQDLEETLNMKFTFSRDFNHIIKTAKANSTYFLSDIEKINILKENNMLNMSSITIPSEYRYNKIDMHTYKLNLDELLRTNLFKLSFILACSKLKREE